MAEAYEPNPKHKHSPTPGRRGTLCPREVDGAALFATAVPDPRNAGQRFNILNGEAYRALPTNAVNGAGDDLWHGHPFPLDKVPAAVQKQWVAAGLLRRLKLGP